MKIRTEAIGELLTHISVHALNQIAANGDFEAPVDGDALAWRRHELAGSIA